ncbi:hypothetical protein AB3S75_031599 [Citrus x aurantiifolia]
MTTGRINQVTFLPDAGARMTVPLGAPFGASVGPPRRARQSFASRDNACSLDGSRPRPRVHTQHSTSESTAETPWAKAAKRLSARHAGNTEPASRPPRTRKGTRRTGKIETSNSVLLVGSTGYRTNPQGNSCAWGKTEADGRRAVRCTSTEPAD